MKEQILQLIEFYKNLGIEEITSNQEVNRTDSLQKNSDWQYQINCDSKEVSKETVFLKNKDFIDLESSNITPLQAIAKLAKKQENYSSYNQDQIMNLTDIIKSAREMAQKSNNLSDLEKAVREFEGCGLKKMATNTVFADGNPNSGIMIIGEAPGNHEDLQGIPFCGDSGKLLNSMFEAIGFKREDLYIANTLFWRPPGNRRPTDDELEICRPFVEKHIFLAKPKLIILMGATAMSSMIKSKDPISKVRGKFLEYNNSYLSQPIKTIVLFHPSYLMRQSIKKKLAWQDLLTIKKFLSSE